MTAQPTTRYRLTAVKAQDDGWQTFDPGQTERDRLEAALAAALSDLASRWVDRAATRVASPRQRKGTRHWQPEFDNDTRIGTKALDAAHATGEDAAAQDASDTAKPLIRPATVAAALALYMALSGDEQPPDESVLAEMTATATAVVLALIAASAARQVGVLTDLINSLDQSGAEMPAIRSAVLDHYPVMQEWARGLAVQAATATVEGGREAAADALAAREDGQVDVLRRWRTRRDERVRESHVKAEGQEQPIGTPFTVGGALLRFPGDPRAPFRETANCRCHLVWRSKRTGRFLPKNEDTEAKARYGADGLTHTGTITVRVGGRSYAWKPDDHPRDRHGRFISTGGEVRTAAGDLAKVTNVVDRNHIQVQTSDGKTQTVDRHSVEVTKAPDGGSPKTNVADVGERVKHDPAHAPMPAHNHPSAPDTHDPQARNAPAPGAPVTDRIRHLRQTMPAQPPKPLDAQHAADMIRASTDVAHHEQRVRSAQQVHDATEAALPADHKNREQVMSALRAGVTDAHEGLAGALAAQHRTLSPQHYAADRVHREWQRIDGSRYDAAIRRASPKQQAFIGSLIRDVVHPVNPRAARDMTERPRWHAANAGGIIDLLKGARDHQRAQAGAPDAPSANVPAPTIAGIRKPGDRVMIRHDGHPRDGQIVTITGDNGATGGIGGGGNVNTDQGAISRHTRVVDAPAADASNPESLTDEQLTAAIQRVEGGLSNYDEQLHANRESAGNNWRQVGPTEEHRAALALRDNLVREQVRRAGGDVSAAESGPLKWRRHPQGLVSSDGNYYIERGVRVGTLYRRATEEDYNNAAAERLVYDYERDPGYGDQSTLPPFDYGTVIGNALMGELRLYAEDDRHNRARAQAGDTPGAASTGGVPSTEQDAAGLYDLAAEFEGDGSNLDRVAVADALRDFADAQTYGNENDKQRSEETLTSTLDTLDESGGSDVATARLIDQARTAIRPVPVTPQTEGGALGSPIAVPDASTVGDVGNINAGLDALSRSDNGNLRAAANSARDLWRGGDDEGAARALDATGDGQASALAESIRQGGPRGAAGSDWGRQEGDPRAYAGLHQPTEGASLDNLLADGTAPADFYTHMHFYKYQGTPADDESEAAIQAARGNPDGMVTIYRAAPPGVTHINPGDWITLSQTYAEQHAMQDDDPSHDWPVYSVQVPARSVHWDGNDINEFGYFGDGPAAVGMHDPGVGSPGQPQNVLPDRFEPGTMTRGLVVNVPPDMAQRMVDGDITADDIITGILEGEAGTWWAPSDVHDPVDAAAYAYSDETVTKAVAEGYPAEYGDGGQAGIILIADHDPAAFVGEDEASRMLMAENVAVREGQALRLRSIFYSPDGQDNWHEVDATGHTINSSAADPGSVQSSNLPANDAPLHTLKVGDRAMMPSGTGYAAATITAIGEDEEEPGQLRVDYTHDNGDLDSLYADPSLVVTRAPAVITRPEPQPDVPPVRNPQRVGDVQVGDTVALNLPDPTPVTITRVEPYGDNADIVTLSWRRDGSTEEETAPFGANVPVTPRTPTPPGPPPRGRVALRTYQRRMIHSYGFATQHPDAAVRRAHTRLLNYEALSQDEAQALAGALREEAARSLPRRAGALNRAAGSFDALDNHLGNMPTGTGIRRSAMDAREGDWVRVNGIAAKVTGITRQQGGKVVTLSLTDDSGQQHTVPLMRGTQIEGLDAPTADPTIEPDPDANDPSTDETKPQQITARQIGAGMVVTLPPVPGLKPEVTGRVTNVKAGRQRLVGATRTVTVDKGDGSAPEVRVMAATQDGVWLHPTMPEPTPVVEDKPVRTDGERSIGHADVQPGDRIRIANSGTGQEYVGVVTQVNPTTGYDEETLSELPGTEISLREDGSTTAYTHVLFGDDRAVLLSRDDAAPERMRREEQDNAARQVASALSREVTDALSAQRAAVLTDVSMAQGQGRDYVLNVVLGPDARYRRTGTNSYGYAVNAMNRTMLPDGLDSQTRRAMVSAVAERNNAVLGEALGRQFDSIVDTFRDATPLPGETDAQMVGRVIGEYALAPKNVDYTDAFMGLARARENLASTAVDKFTYTPSDEERAAAEQRARNALTNTRREAIEKFKAHLLGEDKVSSAIYGGAIQRIVDKYDGVEMAKLLQRDEFHPHPRWSAAVVAAQSYGQDAGRTASIRSAAQGTVNATVRDAMVDVLREMRASTRTGAPTYTEKLGDMLDRIAAEPDHREQAIIEERAQSVARDAAEHLMAGGDPIDEGGEPLPEPGGTWTERLAAWRAVLPDDPDKFGQRQVKIKALGEFTLADLEAGKTPEVVDSVEYVPDRAADGGPGDTAMRHLHALRQVGDAINEEYVRRLGASFPEMGGDPEAYLADIDTRREAAMQEMTRLDREMRAARQEIDRQFTAEAFSGAPADMPIVGVPTWDTVRYRMSALRTTWGQADRDPEQRRREVAEYERLSGVDERRMQAFRDHVAEGGAGRALNEQRNAASEDWRTLRNLHTSERKRVGEVKAKHARDVLAEVRSMGTPAGGGLRYKQGERSQGVKSLRWAEQWYPSDWLTAERQQQLGDFTVKSTQRGYYNRQMTTISISGSSVDEKNQVAVHELGHHMERVVPGLVAAEEAFLWSRTSTGAVGARQREGLSRIYSGPKEVGRKDKFKSHYTGKDYGRGDAHEVFTTGIESLFAGSDYLDDDMRNFMFGTLAALGGPPRTEGAPSKGTSGGARARRVAGQYGEARVAGELGGTFAANPGADRPAAPTWNHDEGTQDYTFTTGGGRTFTATRAATGWRLTDSHGEPMMATTMSRAKAEAHRRYYEGDAAPAPAAPAAPSRPADAAPAPPVEVGQTVRVTPVGRPRAVRLEVTGIEHIAGDQWVIHGRRPSTTYEGDYIGGEQSYVVNASGIQPDRP